MLKKHNKLVVFLVLAAFMFTMVGSASAATFSDVTGNSVEANAIYKLTSLGIIDGYTDGTFGPEKTITRAEFAKIAVYTAGLQAVANGMQGTPSSFKDVSADFWGNGWINVAAAQGFVKGYPDGTFKPQAQITQAEVITVLLRLLGYNDNLQGVWPANYIAKAANLGILDDISFNANAAATRGTVAVLAAESLDENVVVYEASNNLFKEDLKSGAAYTLLEDNFDNAVKTEDVLVLGVEINNNGEYVLNYYNWDLDDKKVVIGEKKLVIAENAVVNGAGNLFALDGAIVDFLQNDDNEVIFISVVPDIATKVFGKVDSVDTAGAAGSWSIEIDDTDYDVAPTFFTCAGKTTVAGTKATVDAYVGQKIAMFFNDDNDVVFINKTSYDASYVVDEVGKDSIKSKNGKRFSDVDEDDDDVLVLRNGAVVKLADLQENDVFYFLEDKRGFDYYIIAIANKVEGEATKISGDDLYIDGTKYTMAGNTLGATLGFYAEDSKGDKVLVADLGDFLGEQILAYKDGNGEIAFITGDTSDSKGGIVGLILDFNLDTLYGTTTNWVKVYTENGEEITYDVEEDYVDDYTAPPAPPDTILTIMAAEGLAAGDLMEFQLNANGEIDDIDTITPVGPVVAYTIDDAVKDYDRIKVGADWKYVTDDTIIFDFDNTVGDLECDLATWADVEDAATINADIYYDDDEIDYLVVASAGGISSSNIKGVFVDDYKTSDGDMVDFFVDGEIKTYEDKTAMLEGAIYVFNANSSDKISIVGGLAACDFGTVPYDGILDKSMSVVVGSNEDNSKSAGAKTFKTTSDTLFYLVDDDGVVVADYYDIDEGDELLVYEDQDLADVGTAEIIVIFEDDADDYAAVKVAVPSLDVNVAPTVVSAVFTNATTLTVTFSEAVTATAAAFTDGKTSAPGTFTVDSLAGSGTTTIVLTITGTPAVATGDTGSVDIANSVKDKAGNALTALNDKAVTSGF